LVPAVSPLIGVELGFWPNFETAGTSEEVVIIKYTYLLKEVQGVAVC